MPSFLKSADVKIAKTPGIFNASVVSIDSKAAFAVWLRTNRAKTCPETE